MLHRNGDAQGLGSLLELFTYGKFVHRNAV